MVQSYGLERMFKRRFGFVKFIATLMFLTTAALTSPLARAEGTGPAVDATAQPRRCADADGRPLAPCGGDLPRSVFQFGTTDAPGPNAALYASPFYTCLRNFYVSTTGSDSNSGSSSSPWLTIQHADSSSREAGDCINVAAGSYKANVLIRHGGSSPTASGYVVYRCATLDACHVLAPGGGHLWGIEQPANFVVIEGFEIDGNAALATDGVADACIGSDGDTYGTGNSSHHLWILNNLIHNCNLAGISFNNKEWYYVIHNAVYNNSWTSGFQGSGISFVVVQCVEINNPLCASGNTYAGGTGTYSMSGMDLSFARPFHNIVAGNAVYNNFIAASNPVACGSHTDGNGIIMDTFLDETHLSLVYPYPTLVGGNTSYSNGGRGVHVFRTSNVRVANNTVYGNGTDTCINAFYLGDLSQAGGSNNVWVDNIAQSVLTSPNSGCGSFCGGRNAPLVAGDAGNIIDSSNVYLNNVTFGGKGVQLFNADIGYFSCSNNKCNANPLLVSPTSSNFALSASSPAIGYGLPGYYVQSVTADAGACPNALSSCP
jgi:parallel beta-helix repeat protein